MSTTFSPFAKPVYVMLKPAGALCNLACDYCYYLEKGKLYPNVKNLVMNNLQQSIADICTWNKRPVLNIVDAYRVIHQNGPQGRSLADVAELKSLIISSNIIAAESASLKLYNQVQKLDLSAVGHITKGEELKLGSTDLSKISIKRIKM